MLPLLGVCAAWLLMVVAMALRDRGMAWPPSGRLFPPFEAPWWNLALMPWILGLTCMVATSNLQRAGIVFGLPRIRQHAAVFSAIAGITVAAPAILAAWIRNGALAGVAAGSISFLSFCTAANCADPRIERSLRAAALVVLAAMVMPFMVPVIEWQPLAMPMIAWALGASLAIRSYYPAKGEPRFSWDTDPGRAASLVPWGFGPALSTARAVPIELRSPVDHLLGAIREHTRIRTRVGALLAADIAVVGISYWFGDPMTPFLTLPLIAMFGPASARSSVPMGRADRARLANMASLLNVLHAAVIIGAVIPLVLWMDPFDRWVSRTPLAEIMLPVSLVWLVVALPIAHAVDLRPPLASNPLSRRSQSGWYVFVTLWVGGLAVSVLLAVFVKAFRAIPYSTYAVTAAVLLVVVQAVIWRWRSRTYVIRDLIED